MSPALLEELTRLSPKDLKELRTRTSVLLEGVETTDVTDENLVYNQIVSLLKSMGHLQVPPMKVVKANTRSAKALKEGSEQLLVYIDTYFQPSRRADKLNAIQLMLKMLVRRLERDRITVSPHSLVQILPRVPEIVDSEFPGYRESGFLRILLKRFHLVTEVA